MSLLEGRTLWELIDRRVAETPDALMAVDEDMRTLTFGELAEDAERAAAGLRELGVGPDVVVSWQLPTWIESMVLVAALSRLDAIQNPILPIYREREVRFCTNQADAKLIIVPSVWNKVEYEAMATDIARDKGDMQVLVADKTLPQGDPASLPPRPGAADPGDQPVRWLFYTSGTTADPKGARHTDANVAAVARGMAERLAVSTGDRNAMVFPFTHVGGITWLFLSLQTGCSNIFLEAFDPQKTPEVLSREGVTLAGAGTVFHKVYLAAQQASDTPLFPRVRGFTSGGAPKPPQLHYDLLEAFGTGIYSAYGLTEAPILTMSGLDDTDEELAHTEGKPLPGVELKLVKLDGTVAGEGEAGEVRVKAPQVMQGYLDSSLDAEAFDEEGYFRTGDLGRLDERGNLVITGRLKDVIIRKGENISASEVEAHLYGHDKIGDVAVIGLADPERGERVCAVVQTAEGADDITLAEMAAHLESQGLMKQKIPEQLEIIEVIPRNPSGKVLKHVLCDRYSTS
ncbi:MAG: Medium-chain fatty-acid--CoA ligase [Acidimicrobiales bacterium]|nr:MAG: cyclohexanecarboxylate-CoA ligase [Actinomycetota bacterium]MBV6507885.1 Medium-chain fatty-acid--CoA ligase [Acidimicrobiales bacterium]RIK06029.1 MAG: cyclohexanecarboxylate-CoA ligase [Acidobacteriota bacterium]